MTKDLDTSQVLEYLEVIEGLIAMCAAREEEIAKLWARVRELEGKLEKKGAASADKPKKSETPARRDILLAESVPHLSHQLAEVLTMNGFQVVGEASTGTQALAMFDEKRPLFAAIDLELPEVDGCEVIRRVKNIQPETRIVALSSVMKKNTVVEAVKAGVTDFITKPVNLSRLVEMLERLSA